MNRNCLLCGVGGQGVVLASKLIAYAAIGRGLEVLTTETIGMAQRGGSVVSHVRIGDAVYSPMIPRKEADVILAFEPAEAVRSLGYLRKGGAVIVNQKEVRPVTDTLGENKYKGIEMIEFLKKNVDDLYVVNAEQICTAANSPKALNTALLGVAVGSGLLGFSVEEMEEELRKHVKPQFAGMNLTALKLGSEMADRIILDRKRRETL